MSLAPRETIMTTLFGLLTGSIAKSFTATATEGSPLLTGIVGDPALFLGMPVSGPKGVVLANTFVLDLSVEGEVMLSQDCGAGAVGATFVTGFQTTGRRATYANQVAAQPALFLVQLGDIYPTRRTGMPAKVTMAAEIWLYSNAGKNPDFAPVITLNNLIDTIAQILKPAPVIEAQNLGLPNLVEHCWIEGEIKEHPGDQGGQAIATIPIHILTKTML